MRIICLGWEGKAWSDICKLVVRGVYVFVDVLLYQNPMSWRLGLSLLYSLSAKLSGCHLLRVPKYWLSETHWLKY